MEKDKIRQMASVKANADWPPETDTWYAAYYAFIAGYEASVGEKQPDTESKFNKHIVKARAFVESCVNLTEYVDGSKIAHRFKKFTVPVIEYNELRKAADDYDSEHVR